MDPHVAATGSPLCRIIWRIERGMSVSLSRTGGKGAKLSNVTQAIISRENISNAVAGHPKGLRYQDLSGWKCFDSGQAS